MTDRTSTNNTSMQPKLSSPLLIALAWALVILPTGWGLTYTVQNALKIFTAPAPAASAPITPTITPAK